MLIAKVAVFITELRNRTEILNVGLVAKHKNDKPI